MITISAAVNKYLTTVELGRSKNTWRTYSNAMSFFIIVLGEHKLSPEQDISLLSEDAVAWTISAAKDYSASTERLYLTAVTGFYEFLSAENLSKVNLSRVHLLIRQRARRPGLRLPQFPQDEIENVLLYAQSLNSATFISDEEHLRNLRDRAFLITLADTGLRVHEACALRRGDLDWYEGRAVIIGKGNKQAVVRFSARSQTALKEYIQARSMLDGAFGRALTALPVFARHDKGAGSKIKPITTTTGRNIVAQRVREAIGDSAPRRITPHSFRHYFVTRVLRSSGNLKMAQELARHQSISVTQRYAHLSDNQLDEGYRNIFEDTDTEK